MSNKNTKSVSKLSQSGKAKPSAKPGNKPVRLTTNKSGTKRSIQPPPAQPNPLIYAIGAAVVLAIVIAIVLILRNQNSPTSTSTAFVAANSPCYTAAAPTTQPPVNAPKKFSAPQQVIDPTHVYCAFFTTAHGVIVAELFPKSAPKHVNSFVFLAQQGYFDNITWHRVLPGFVAQSGDPTGTGAGGPGYAIPLEIDPALKYDKAGMLAMARTNDPNSAGSQFYITYGPTTSLQDQYTIFGEVVRGMEVANQITPRDPSQNPNAPPGDALISIRILDTTTGK